jgi:signal transduction histidine kinase
VGLDEYGLGDKDMGLTPEILIPRLGEYLVERGMITQDDLQRALDYQENIRKTGQQSPILGQILVKLNIISKDALDQAITEQIIQLRSALQEYNRQLEQRVRERTIELEKAISKLSELNQLKSNFVANLSHELRTPLTHIKGYIELLLANGLGPLSLEQDQALQVMQRSTGRLEKLIEDLLLFSMSERTHIALKSQPFNLQPLCNEIINNVMPQVNQRKLTLAFDCPDQLPDVSGDQQKIGWVISQFLDNAIKFTPPGGHIVLKLEKVEIFIQISVSDTGIGFKPEQYEEIFEPFHQLDGSSTRSAGGAGLGLNLARKIVEAHGSVIHVVSSPGAGSQFKFVLKMT